MFEIAEATLIPFATPVTPEGTDTRSVAHQWIHALLSGTQLYAEARTEGREFLIAALNNAGVTLKNLAASLAEGFPMHPAPGADFTFIDLFAGIGGMRLGFEQAKGQCVFSSEFEKNAQQTYFRNHGDLPFGDITKIPANDIPDHDVLIAGFPCQPFSHAGLKLGIEDVRGTLFYDIARILEKKKPKAALLENVKGLISHEKGYTLHVILKKLTSLGYSCNIPKDVINNGNASDVQAYAKSMVLRSCDFGVPQNRQRIYIVLWRDEFNTAFAYPKPTGEPTRVGDILETNPDPSYTISDRLWEGHQRRKTQNEINGKGFGFGRVTPDMPYTNTISARYYKDGSEILIDLQNGKNPRKLTHREAARLQGFPDDFLISSSPVQAYKQFGNSVSVPVIKRIAEEIRKQKLRN